MKTRKELKKEYKQMKFKMGVFQIRNTVNNKVFIDSSTDLVAIWNRQRMELNFGSHPNLALQKEWKTFGEDKFVYEIVAELEQKSDETTDYKKELKALKEMYLEKLQPFADKGYNREITK
ncbi:MAG: GIY-YIG nuclease family protein [Bacteroidales bacterium]|nr:GIY-YIG nuclease family protein [Bacteroidales bacterium]